MKKPFLRHILASSLILIPSISEAATIADKNAKVGIQRSFVNLDFSKPVIGSSYKQLPQEDIPGWYTTHSYWNNPAGRLIEIWKGAGAAALPNASTDQYAELNAAEESALYQKVCLFGGEKFDWSFDHAGREKSKDETIQFLIGIVNDGVAGKDKYTIDSKQQVVSEHTANYSGTNTGRWTTLKGSNTEVSKSVVPEEGGIYSFIFKATTSGSLGNLIDNIVLKLKPAVEFSAADGEFIENSTEIQPIPFKIVGQIASEADMPTLNFKVAYSEGTALKKRAVYGVDYTIYKRSGNEYIELTSTADGLEIDKATNNIKFNYLPSYMSGLDYSQGVEVNGLAIKLKDNFAADGDKILPFAFNLDANSKAITTSLSSCSTAAALQEFQLSIADNDIDLAINKELVEKIPASGSKVSYNIEIENKTEGSARDVVLKDSLFAGLIKDTDLKLTCSEVDNGGNKASCPVLATDAATQLFSATGLNIGKIPGKSKLKFTVSGLKVDPNAKADANASNYTEYNPSKDYAGYIANYAEVSTSSNDIDAENNKFTAENRIIAASDLSNNKPGAAQKETGTGLFYIAQEGRNGATALLTKTADTEGKVYFPLNIQNSSVYAQNYKLYASSTAINPASAEDYTALDTSSISSFVTGVQVKFYPVIDSECKAGLSSSDISQMNVSANSTVQVCAEITATSAEAANIPVWFAIESAETGLGDIIKNSIMYSGLSVRNLILVNDQQAQVQIGGSYVFAHRLTNNSSIPETGIQFALNPLTPKDGFAYTLFIDTNSNGVLDSSDVQVKDTDTSSIASGEYLALLVKVQAPATATNGMRSQVELKAVPIETVKDISLLPLINTDTITVGINQISLQKMQFKQAECVNMTADQIVKAAYQISSQTIGRGDCIVYRIMVSNIGAETIKAIDVNDMYPAYTFPWSSNKMLPMTDSNDVVTEQNQQIKTVIKELKPNEQKSLYFGIKLQ
jgi:hypothetical protein